MELQKPGHLHCGAFLEGECMYSPVIFCKVYWLLNVLCYSFFLVQQLAGFLWPVFSLSYLCKDTLKYPSILDLSGSSLPLSHQVASALFNICGSSSHFTIQVRLLDSWKFPGGEHGNPLQHSSLENLCEQRSLEGYSPWDCKDRTERLNVNVKDALK